MNLKKYLVSSVVKKNVTCIFALCCLFSSYQLFAETNKTTKTTIQEGKSMNTSGMPSAKRVGPEDVTPVTANGVRYEVIHWGRERGLNQNGGYIVAIDSTSGKELWVAKIYTIDYIPKLETDVQDIFIRSIELSEDKKSLKVIDERGREFMLDLSTQQVTAH